MERYIKPSIDIVKINAQVALLADSLNASDSLDDNVIIHRAPSRSQSLSYDAWSQWGDDSSEDDYGSLEVE